MRKIDSHEVHPRLHERGNERDITGKPVELGDDQLCPVNPTKLESFRKPGTIGSLSAFDLRHLRDEVPPPSI
jgi:hypothetical protein